MIPSDPAECAMESRIAQEWDILGSFRFHGSRYVHSITFSFFYMYLSPFRFLFLLPTLVIFIARRSLYESI